MPLCPTFLLCQSPGEAQDSQVTPHHLDSCPYILCISPHWPLSPFFPNFQNPFIVSSGTHSIPLAKYPTSWILLLYTRFTFPAPTDLLLSSRSSALSPGLSSDSCSSLPCLICQGPGVRASLSFLNYSFSPSLNPPALNLMPPHYISYFHLLVVSIHKPPESALFFWGLSLSNTSFVVVFDFDIYINDPPKILASQFPDLSSNNPALTSHSFPWSYSRIHH